MTKPTLSYQDFDTATQRIKYHKNLDIEPVDSYFSRKDNFFSLKFPMNEGKIDIEGLHFYNLIVGEILVVHISHKNGGSMRDKDKKQMVSFKIEKEHLDTIPTKFTLKQSEKIHVIIYNEKGPYPGLNITTNTKNDKSADTNLILPKETGGGGVIVQGP
jgi:hypothetical protein